MTVRVTTLHGRINLGQPRGLWLCIDVNHRRIFSGFELERSLERLTGAVPGISGPRSANCFDKRNLRGRCVKQRSPVRNTGSFAVVERDLGGRRCWPESEHYLGKRFWKRMVIDLPKWLYRKSFLQWYMIIGSFERKDENLSTSAYTTISVSVKVNCIVSWFLRVLMEQDGTELDGDRRNSWKFLSVTVYSRL